MLRTSLSGLSLVALVATAAAAQVPFQETFQFTSVGVAGFNDYHGKFYDVSGLTNIGLTGELNNTFFQIWCVDPMEYVNYGQISVATITPLNTSTFSPDNFAGTFAERTQTGPDHGNGDVSTTHTGVSGAAAQNDYEQAAYLASEMTAGNAVDYENAIWYVMGYGAAHNTAGAQAAILTINLADPNFHFDEWGVITSGLDEQEFIYHRENGQFLSNTPEPATMSLMAMGLVGMAGTSIRRRKQRKA
jgi:hypothetical protein